MVDWAEYFLDRGGVDGADEDFFSGLDVFLEEVKERYGIEDGEI